MSGYELLVGSNLEKCVFFFKLPFSGRIWLDLGIIICRRAYEHVLRIDKGSRCVFRCSSIFLITLLVFVML